MKLRCVLLIALVLSVAVCAAGGVKISYRLPTDGPLPRTYRVTLAITLPDDPDWIVSTFVSGGVCTVTRENGGRFTEEWDGLDENYMPVPAGAYGVKGIFMPAAKWRMDGQYHSFVARYRFGAGDSWSPAPENDDKFPWIFGHVFGLVQDVSVGPNGKASFWCNYIENSWNPFLVDLNKPVGYDQVIARYPSGGAAGGPTTACDGEHVWSATANDGRPVIFRADRRWGPDINGFGLRCRRVEEMPPSMTAWRHPETNRRFVYAAQAGEVNRILVFDGDSSEPLAEIPLRAPLAISLDRTQPGRRLIAMHKTNAGWAVSAVALEGGLPRGEWKRLFDVKGIGNPTDCEMDSAGRFYVCDPDANQVFQLDGNGTVRRRFARATQQRAGHYDHHVFMRPHKLATWTDAIGEDRIIVIEGAGPGRISEWSANGELLREWFLCQDSASGYCLDPEQPEHIYGTLFGKGVVRFKVDYEKAAWAVDAVWPDIACSGDFPGGKMYPRVIHAGGRAYLGFMGGAHAGGTWMLYRFDGDKLVPASGTVKIDGQFFWWHDANGDGRLQPNEYKDNPNKGPSSSYWADLWLEDLSLTVISGYKVFRLAPTGFDGHGNPIYDGSKWETLLVDPIFDAKAKGTPDALHGGNEIGTFFWDWTDVAGSMREGFYVAAPSVPRNPGGIDTGGSYHAQWKLSRYVPDGKGGYRMKWRVGRKAFRLAEPGQIYGPQHISNEVHGIVGLEDSNGLYHLFTNEGMYVDTLMVDVFRRGLGKSGMYGHSGESWYGKHYLDRKTGKVFLFMGRGQGLVYEVENWRPGVIKAVAVDAPRVSITAGQIAPANEIALRLRGGAGAAHVAKFYPAPGGGPAMDGSMTGWEACTPVKFGLDDERTVEVRPMYDPGHIYLRWHVRLPGQFAPVELGDPIRLFTHERAADFVSFYFQGDPNASPGAVDGRPGDMRIVFAIVKDGAAVRPVALGMYAAPPNGEGKEVTYLSPVGRARFGHVGLMQNVRLAHAIDDDGKGFVIAAAIPAQDIAGRPQLPGLRTSADFAATFGGKTNFWWANVGNMSNTLTTDEPSEARLYPGAWAQAQFVPMDSLPIREWITCGPWGGEKLKERPNDPHPQPKGHAFSKQFYKDRTYPPDGGNVDLKAVYEGPETEDVRGARHKVRWRPMSISGDFITAAEGRPTCAFAATWIYFPQGTDMECDIICPTIGDSGIWINDQPAARKYTGWGMSPRKQQTLRFRKGWNKIFCRGWTSWGGMNFGLVLKGPEEVLWSVKVSPTPRRN